MSYVSKNFRLFHVSLNLRFFSAHVSGVTAVTEQRGAAAAAGPAAAAAASGVTRSPTAQPRDHNHRPRTDGQTDRQTVGRLQPGQTPADQSTPLDSRSDRPQVRSGQANTSQGGAHNVEKINTKGGHRMHPDPNKLRLKFNDGQVFHMLLTRSNKGTIWLCNHQRRRFLG